MAGVLSLSPGHHYRYLTDQVGKGKENYYTGAVDAGEPPGVWQGKGAEFLGLSGEVDHQDMEALYGHFIDPRDPGFRDKAMWDTAARLGRAPGKYKTPGEIYDAKLAAAQAKGIVTTEQQLKLWAAAQKEARSAVSFIDATFSPSKDITVLYTAFEHQAQEAMRAGNLAEMQAWRAKAQQVKDAIWAGQKAAMDYLSAEAGYSRAGYHGKDTAGRWVDAHDFTIAAFFQHTSRDGDPQLHIHSAILNRVLCSDGKWRTLDSQAIHKARGAAAAIGERVMEEMLTRTLGIKWLMRADGVGREMAGIDQATKDLFSSRRRAISAKVKQFVDEFEAKYQRNPNALELSDLSQQATLQTRRVKDKVFEPMSAMLDRWAARLRERVDTSMGKIAREVPGQAVKLGPVTFHRDNVIKAALAEIQTIKSGWTRHDLLRAINKHLPDTLGGLEPEHVRALLTELTDYALAPKPDAAGTAEEVILLTAPPLVVEPEEMRRADGKSEFEAPCAQVYTTAKHYRRESALIAAAQDTTPVAALNPVVVEAQLAIMQAAAGRQFSEEQLAAIRGILTSGRRWETLIGAAGAGKSFTLGAITEIWTSPGLWGLDRQEDAPRVFGLATSQAAADVMKAEGVDRAINISLWVQKQTRIADGKPVRDDSLYQLRPGDMVLIDEAAMTSIEQLEAIERITRDAGVKVLATGDPAQLPAVGTPGGMALAAEAGNSYELTDVRRFANTWEAEASLRIRAGDIEALTEYAMRGRIVDGGTEEQAQDLAVRGYVADYVAGHSTLLMVSSGEEAAEVSSKVRTMLQGLGLVAEPTAQLKRDGSFIGAGDVVQTRRNDWRKLRTDGKAVINRELWKVIETTPDGGLRLALMNNPQHEVTVDKAYVDEHVTLGYATTHHSGQGATVDYLHGLPKARMGAGAQYMEMTRARYGSTHYVTTVETGDHAPQEMTNAGPQPAGLRRSALEVLASILEARDEGLSAHEIQRRSSAYESSLRTLAARYTEVAERSYAARFEPMADELVNRGLMSDLDRNRMRVDAERTGQLWRLLRAAELGGNDPRQVLENAVTEMSLSTAKSVPAVLHSRIERNPDVNLEPLATTSYAERTPQGTDNFTTYLAETARWMDTRRHELGEQIAMMQPTPPWALKRLGTVPPPESSAEHLEWITQAGVIAAYREQAGIEDPVDAIGPCPPQGMPEQRAAWHAAWHAFDAPTETREAAALSDVQLREQVKAYERAETWAPEWVGDQMAQTAHAARTFRQDAALAATEASSALDEQQARLHLDQADALLALSSQLQGQLSKLEEAHEARGEWVLHTADLRAKAEAAAEELAARGAEEAPADTTRTKAELYQAAMESAEEQRARTADAAKVLDAEWTEEATEAAEPGTDLAVEPDAVGEIVDDDEPLREPEPAQVTVVDAVFEDIPADEVKPAEDKVEEKAEEKAKTAPLSAEQLAALAQPANAEEALDKARTERAVQRAEQALDRISQERAERDEREAQQWQRIERERLMQAERDAPTLEFY